MKLTDLHPKFFVFEEGGPRVGLTFYCPHCLDARLGVVFHHEGHQAIEDDYIHAKSPATQHIWTESGDDFEHLTLSPSVDASASGHWHGFITNGEVK